MIEDQNPLQHQLEADLNASDWLQKFKAWSLFLNTLKEQIPLTQLCELKWVTDNDTLVIHCPNPETRDALHHQTAQIQHINHVASAIILKHSAHPDIIITAPQP